MMAPAWGARCGLPCARDGSGKNRESSDSFGARSSSTGSDLAVDKGWHSWGPLGPCNITCYHTKNNNDGPLSPYFNVLKHIYLISDTELEIYEFGNECNKIKDTKIKIGKISLVFHKNQEIEIKHIELDKIYQNKKIGTAAIAQVLEILAARTAPLNIMVFFISKLENMQKIGHNLKFHKQGDEFSRLCRI